jgi:hypothetical protein
MNIYFGKIKYEEPKRKSLGAYVIVPSPSQFIKGVLVIWNRRWKVYNILAGHWEEKDGMDKDGKPDFLKTAKRETKEEFEELGIKLGDDDYSLYPVGGKMEYVAYSQRAKEWTYYSHQLFLLKWEKTPHNFFHHIISPVGLFIPPYYLLHPDESPVPLADAIYIFNNESQEFRDILLKLGG